METKIEDIDFIPASMPGIIESAVERATPLLQCKPLVWLPPSFPASDQSFLYALLFRDGKMRGGQATDPYVRYRVHRREALTGGKRAFHHAWRTQGDPAMIVWGPFPSKDIGRLEAQLIIMLDCIEPRGYNLEMEVTEARRHLWIDDDII